MSVCECVSFTSCLEFRTHILIFFDSVLILDFLILTNTQAINSIFEQQGWDFEVTGGHIGSLMLKVPWNCLMSEDSLVEVSDLYLCLRPQPRAKNGIYRQFEMHFYKCVSMSHIGSKILN